MTATKTPPKPTRKPSGKSTANPAKPKAAKKTTAPKPAKVVKKTVAKTPVKAPAPGKLPKPGPAKLVKPPKALTPLALAKKTAAEHRLPKVQAWEANRPGRLRATECGVPKKFATVLGVKPGESVTLGLEAFAGMTFDRNHSAKVADRLNDTQIAELFTTMFPQRTGYHGDAGKSWTPELVQEFRARYNRGDFTDRAKPGQPGAAESYPFSQRWTGDGWVTVKRGRKLGSKATLKPKDDGVPQTGGFGNRKATKATKAAKATEAKASPVKAAKKTVKKATRKTAKKTTAKKTTKRTVKAKK